MPDSHTPLGKRIIGIEIEQVLARFRLCHVKGGKKGNGQTAFRHGYICFGILYRDQRKAVQLVFCDDLTDILTYFLTWNAGDQGLVFQMVQGKCLGSVYGILFRTRHKTGQRMGPGNYKKPWGTGKDLDKAVGKYVCSGSSQHRQVQFTVVQPGQKIDVNVLGQGELHIGVFPVEYGENLFGQKGTGDGTGPDL